MSTRLIEALQARRDDIAEGIVEAEQELEALRRRREELEGLIKRARVAIGTEIVGDEPQWSLRMYLHDAMLKVLRESPQGVMRAPALAAEINRRDLYRQRDGGPVSSHQIHARVFNYPDLFERTSEGIRARA